MQIYTIKKDKIKSQVLPENISGSFWIEDKDRDGNSRNLINIAGINGSWQMKSNFEAKIMLDDIETDDLILKDYNFYTLKLDGDNEYVYIYCSPVYDKSTKVVTLNNNVEIVIGKSNDCNIVYDGMIADRQALLQYKSNNCQLTNLELMHPIYLNDYVIESNKLKNGDRVFIWGLKIIVINNLLLVSGNQGKIKYNIDGNVEDMIISPLPLVDSNENEQDIPMYEKDEYFFRAPRFRTITEKTEVEIDPPPAPENLEEPPLLYTVGPMITMALTSMVSGVTAALNILNGTKTFKESWTSIVVCVAMLISTILWPSLNKAYQRRKKQKREAYRLKKYSEYIDEQKKYIMTVAATQRQILIENIVSLDACRKIIYFKERKLWERKLGHDDFLKLRLGIGSFNSLIDVKYPEKHFSLDEDDLRKCLDHLGEDTKLMRDVPVSIELTKKIVTAIVGNAFLTKKFIDGLFLQMMAFHSFEDLKIVVFTNKQNEVKWEYLKTSPHCWSNDKKVRFFCTEIDEATQISNYLAENFSLRKYEDGEGTAIREADYRSFIPYFLIFTDDYEKMKKMKIIECIEGQATNYGFSLIINNERLLGLPNECTTFIDINKNTSGIFENELIAEKQQEFVADFPNDIDIEECTKKIANIPIEIAGGKYQLPKTLGFLEMYNVGKVEQLNSLSRWKSNNPIMSLQALIGVDESGELFKLDLHEKAHGPHGLIAGMTGSGKSEFIITYILSMAVNYHPDEVAFVLIDYKGGGLTGAFENRETGLKLPHLAGTITNLDVNEMNRALASIESELKRRQDIFKKTRESLGESTVDIYKYQKLYREKKVSEPVPHLFIISDEFAELKVQQPDFMAKLVSTARIGRSLGVHLILATQKPSGVVDDQIWSNTKFRVCLKVQDKSDSNEMLKRPEAASLRDVGRFYLQVGYNDLFTLGQSAWCGAPYQNTDKLKKKVDTAIDFINDIGYVYKSVNDDEKSVMKKDYGEELQNVVKYLCDIAKKSNVSCRKLWLDSIPSHIYVGDLMKKYDYKKENYSCNLIVGEYDNPKKQYQGLLTLSFSDEGNTIIYGAADSGIDDLLGTLIYSSIINYGPQEINIYIIDCGAETLKSYQDAPQVGDILFSNDREKITNLFKMLFKEGNERKKIFSDYGGNYKSYCQLKKEPYPAIIFMINGYESFCEFYPDLEEKLIQITRDFTKYGIYCILTVSGLIGARFRLRQNFGQELILQLNEEDGYSTILGGGRKTPPSKINGRGLIKKDDIYEFQTAYPFKSNNFIEELRNFCTDLNKKYPFKAKKVPILPEKVTVEDIKNEIKGLSSVPIGISTNSLKIVGYDFKTNFINIVTSLETDSFDGFLTSISEEFILIDNTRVIILDSGSICESQEINKNIDYCTSNFEDAISKIEKFVNQAFDYLSQNDFSVESINRCVNVVCIILGFGELKSTLKDATIISRIFDVAAKIKGKVTFVIADNLVNIKKEEYEAWYKKYIVSTDGIWIGSGISEQYSLRVAKASRYLSQEISSEYGYAVKRGRETRIKIVGNSIEEDENNDE